MTIIRLDSEKVERIVSQTLRDEFKMLPANANSAASAITTRLLAAVPTPNHQPLKGHRIIAPGGGPEFREALSALLKRAVDAEESAAIWRLVFDRGRDVSSDVADPR